MFGTSKRGIDKWQMADLHFASAAVRRL